MTAKECGMADCNPEDVQIISWDKDHYLGHFHDLAPLVFSLSEVEF